jgi:hypothetical protein
MTPDIDMMWMTPEDTCWKNRTNMALGLNSGKRPDSWRFR